VAARERAGTDAGADRLARQARREEIHALSRDKTRLPQICADFVAR